jgi:hypothetical protein
VLKNNTSGFPLAIIRDPLRTIAGGEVEVVAQQDRNVNPSMSCMDNPTETPILWDALERDVRVYNHDGGCTKLGVSSWRYNDEQCLAPPKHAKRLHSIIDD